MVMQTWEMEVVGVGTKEDVGMGAGATPRRRMLAGELESAR
jgi:hypothetical protein